METILHVDNVLPWKQIVQYALLRDDHIKLVSQDFSPDLLAELEHWEYALIITELSGDDRSETEGLELIKLLAEKNPSIPIVVLSGVVTVDRIVQSADAPNVVDILPKQDIPSSRWLRDRIIQHLQSS